jgi:hypothetical protein
LLSFCAGFLPRLGWVTTCAELWETYSVKELTSVFRKKGRKYTSGVADPDIRLKTNEDYDGGNALLVDDLTQLITSRHSSIDV